MKERIKELIDFYDLTQTEFADKLGISKGYISQMLHNIRPITDDIKEKILESFPDVSRDWLENGRGEITDINFESDSLFSPTTIQAVANQSTLANANVDNEKNNAVEPKNIQDSQSFQQSQLKQQFSSQQENYTTNEKTSQSSIEPEIQNKKTSQIERVLIFYTDGTFTEHKPRND